MGEQAPRIAIMASGDIESGGGGSTANKFARDVLTGKLGMELGVVICNNPPGTVGVYDHFDRINDEFELNGDSKIDVVTIGPSTHPGRPQKRGQSLDESEAVCRLLEERGIDFVVMLGYLRILTGEFIDTWGWKPEYADDERYGYRNGLYHPQARIGNNHPAILPFTADTHGLGAHERVVKLHDAGKLRYTAMTWHLVSKEVDRGPIIDEEPVRIGPNDDAGNVSFKVQTVEKKETAKVYAKYFKLRAEHLRAA